MRISVCGSVQKSTIYCFQKLHCKHLRKQTDTSLCIMRVFGNDLFAYCPSNNSFTALMEGSAVSLTIGKERNNERIGRESYKQFCFSFNDRY